MTSIIPLNFEESAVRVVMSDDAPWFVAKDVCDVLEIAFYRNAITRLDEDERGWVLVNTLGGEQKVSAVNESGLNALILGSRKPAAKRFRKWITAEVIPTLLREGIYTMPGLDAGDAADLEAKRAYYEDLRPGHREIADRRAAAVAQVQALIAEGNRVDASVTAVAAEFEVSKRTVYDWRKQVYMVPRPDHGAALAPKWSAPRAPQIDCHPEAQRLFIDGIQRGRRVSDSYRRMLVTAIRNDWEPIPSEQTMRRRAKTLLAPASTTPTQNVRSA